MSKGLFSKYEIQGEIKAPKGRFQAYRALQKGFDRPVELRIYERPDGFASSEFQEMRRIFSLAASFDHPNIVPLLDVGYTKTRLFWTSGFRPAVSFEDFLNRLKGQKLGATEVFEVALALASALDCLHGKGLVHRLLSTDTIYLHAYPVLLLAIISRKQPYARC